MGSGMGGGGSAVGRAAGIAEAKDAGSGIGAATGTTGELGAARGGVAKAGAAAMASTGCGALIARNCASEISDTSAVFRSGTISGRAVLANTA